MKLFLSALVTFSLYGCIKEKMTEFTAELYNATSHDIMILPYKGGVVNPTDTILLGSNQTFEIAHGTERGIKTTPGFYSTYFGSPDDSIVVVFDDAYKVTHYANTPSSLAPKYYLSSSNRNIVNPQSYLFETHEVSRYRQWNHHKYFFAEEDYVFASQ